VKQLASNLILICRESSDLAAVLRANGIRYVRCDDACRALAEAPLGAGLMLLADGYPQQRTPLDAELLRSAKARRVRCYVEFPLWLPEGAPSETRVAGVERAVVASHAFAPGLERMRILELHRCHFLPLQAQESLLVLARLAGYDSACYGLPREQFSLLFEHPAGDLLVAATRLSQFVSGRYMPTDAWQAVWTWILRWLGCPQENGALVWQPTVRPSYGLNEPLPTDAERQAFERGATWFGRARLFPHLRRPAEGQRRLAAAPLGSDPAPDADWPCGDGSRGMIEGATSVVLPDGAQDWRYSVRADCMGEATMCLALHAVLSGDASDCARAKNLNDFIYHASVLSQGPRADPRSPSYGLLGWSTNGDYPGCYYGDDNARCLMGTLAAAALLGEHRWDEPILRCLLANLRTTGPLGFRNNTLTERDLQANGWHHYWTTERVNCAPHYESWLWAMFLWAYRHTGYAPFRDRAYTAIRMTMAAYPDGWRWTNGIQQERARMLLPLAWLVRVEDTPEHRQWLRFMAGELVKCQDACGAIREEIGPSGHGAYAPPDSNDDYGRHEAPLIQQNGDPLCDLVYTTNFAFVGLHEAAIATDEPICRDAEDRLARFLCRIQIRSERHPELDGGWFRAFDFRRWEYWGSNADSGWGAWCIESGWTQAWIASVLALRTRHQSLWDLTAHSPICQHLPTLLPVMGLNP